MKLDIETPKPVEAPKDAAPAATPEKHHRRSFLSSFFGGGDKEGVKEEAKPLTETKPTEITDEAQRIANEAHDAKQTGSETVQMVTQEVDDNGQPIAQSPAAEAELVARDAAEEGYTDVSDAATEITNAAAPASPDINGTATETPAEPENIGGEPENAGASVSGTDQPEGEAAPTDSAAPADEATENPLPGIETHAETPVDPTAPAPEGEQTFDDTFVEGAAVHEPTHDERAEGEEVSEVAAPDSEQPREGDAEIQTDSANLEPNITTANLDASDTATPVDPVAADQGAEDAPDLTTDLQGTEPHEDAEPGELRPDPDANTHDRDEVGEDGHVEAADEDEPKAEDEKEDKKPWEDYKSESNTSSEETDVDKDDEKKDETKNDWEKPAEGHDLAEEKQEVGGSESDLEGVDQSVFAQLGDFFEEMDAKYGLKPKQLTSIPVERFAIIKKAAQSPVASDVSAAAAEQFHKLGIELSDEDKKSLEEPFDKMLREKIGDDGMKVVEIMREKEKQSA